MTAVACLLDVQRMVINLPFLFVGVLLLWFPRPWMRFGAIVRRRRHRGGSSWKQAPWNRQDTGDPRLNFLHEFTKARNYFDLFRALVGSLVVIGGYQLAPALAAAAGAPRLLTQEVLLLKLAILLVATLLQTLRYEHRRVSFFAPVFFIAGLSFVLCGPWAAVFAFTLVWSVSSMFNGPHAFLSVYALLLASFGLLFRAVNYRFVPTVNTWLVIAAAGLCLLPVLLSLLTKRRLGVFTRKGAHVRMV